MVEIPLYKVRCRNEEWTRYMLLGAKGLADSLAAKTGEHAYVWVAGETEPYYTSHPSGCTCTFDQ